MFEADDIINAINDCRVKVGVVGLGYVGLPLALAFVKSGIRVFGFDTNSERAWKIGAGESPMSHISHDSVMNALSSGLLRISNKANTLEECDVILVCVPTPLGKKGDPNLESVTDVARTIARLPMKPRLIVLESTVYPGATEGSFKDALEEGGARCGEDFLLAFSPEREDPGNPDFGTTSIPKIVGGFDDVATKVATAFYDVAFNIVVPVESPKVAEAAKLLENTFRMVNIALVNEVKVAFYRMGIDPLSVIDAASTKPFGFMRFDPGPGVGGHCIPIDPHYLNWSADSYGRRIKMIDVAARVNGMMPAYVIDRIRVGLASRGEAIRGSRILIVGVAYKRGVDDVRESPALALIEVLRGFGAEVEYHDPLVKNLELGELEFSSVPLSDVSKFSAAVVATDQERVDWNVLIENAKLVIDARGVYRGDHQNLVRA